MRTLYNNYDTIFCTVLYHKKFFFLRVHIMYFYVRITRLRIILLEIERSTNEYTPYIYILLLMELLNYMLMNTIY